MPITGHGAKWVPSEGRWTFFAPYAAPEVGYKYRKFNDDGLRILRNRAIWYASPASLNDPLDCRIDVRAHFEALLARHAETTRLGTFLRAVGAARVGMTADGPKIALHDSINELLNEGGVFCLSGTAIEPLMWAHYSDGHRGFCIGFARWYIDWLRTQLKTHKVAGFGPVNYVSSPNLTNAFLEQLGNLRDFKTNDERINWVKDYAQGIIVEVLSTKARAWRYEREYRSMRTSPGAVPFPPTAIAEIVFGIHAAEADQRAIREILSGDEWNHVRYRRAQFSQHRFEFSLIDV